MQYYANILITPHFFIFCLQEARVSIVLFLLSALEQYFTKLSECLLFTWPFSKEWVFFCLLNHLTLNHALQEGCRTIPKDYLKNYEKACLRHLRFQWLYQIVAFEFISIAKTQFFPYMLLFPFMFLKFK